MTVARSPLLRATITLMAGGALAQALPLLLGPLLTRLYTPTQFGLYHLFAAVAANVAVVACARYEHALPLAQDDHEARALVALCRCILLAVVAFSAVGAIAWALRIGALWPLWLPAAVGAFGGLSLATLAAMRAQRFGALATSRVLQHGGGAVLQAAAGAAGAGLWGLIVAPIAAALAAAAWLRPRLGQGWQVSRAAMQGVARRHRDFPLLNTPHAFLGALQDTLAVALIAAWQGPAAAGFWGLALRYLKAPATLVGGAVSQALYPALAAGGAATEQGRSAVRRVMRTLALLALPLVLALWLFAPAAFAGAFGASWREAGELARALALYIGVHFVASPLSVATMAWGAQAWALKLSLVGQALFIAALACGLAIGGLNAAGWAVSAAMALYFGWFFWKLATWPVGNMNGIGWRASVNRLRRRVARWLFFRMLFGEVSQGRRLPNTRISAASCIEHEDRLTLGDHVFIGPFNFIEASGGITLEEGVQITSHVSITTHSSHRAMRVLGREYVAWAGERPGWVAGPVHIGAYSFIGPQVLIEAGTRLGRGTLVRAGSVVRGDFPDFAVLDGRPAQVVGDARQRDEALLQRHPELRVHYEAWAGRTQG